jgi:hypothetical protein
LQISFRIFPEQVRRSHLDFPLIKLETRLWCLKIQVWRNEALLHNQNTFDQASNTAGSFQMTDIGFD